MRPFEPYVVRDGLAVYRIGKGEPVLLMPAPHRFERPGLPESDALIEGLVAQSRQVITYDPPGSGHSDRPARLSMAEMHECAGQALDACGIRNAVDAAGHSMAGLTLLAYALERPSRIRRLVLIGTGSGGPAYMGAPGALWNRTHPDFPGLAFLGILHLAWPCRATETTLNNYISRRSFVDRRLAPTERLLPGDWLRHRRGNPEWHRIAKRLDYSGRLCEIAVPTLVLCGRQDPQYPPACSEQLAARIPGAKLEFFERSGHFPYMEEPAAFWQSVRAFLGPPRPRLASSC
ncbi:MAG: alpha/beta fold hydrolase [Micromonosporaceae bacterium]